MLPLALLIGSLASGATGQGRVATFSDDPTGKLLLEWIEAVRSHVPGEADDSARRIAELSYADLETLRKYVAALSFDRQRSSTAWEKHASTAGRGPRAEITALRENLKDRFDLIEFWRRAALLHTDAVLVAAAPRTTVDAPNARRRRTFQERQQAQRGALARSPDGRLDSFQLPSLHWDFAREMLAILPGGARDPIVPRWYRAIGAYFAGDSNIGEAQTHFAHARTAAPNDAHVLFGEACLQESIGAPRVQAFVRATTLPNGLLFLGVSSPETHFRRAQSLFEQALAADGRLVEARLRLGRVLIELGSPSEALVHLARVVTESTDARLSFFAHLFIGEAAQALNRAEDARASYARAVALFPQSHAARTALSYVERTAGDRATAVSTLLPTLTTPVEDDPWWQYYLGDSPNLPALLEELRTPHREPLK